MNVFERIGSLIQISRSQKIVRRYLVVNGFDGALTMLGLMMGFLVNAPELAIMLNVCLGAAIALGVSGMSSAYVSEAAERQRELDNLEEAMLTNMRESVYGDVARWVPLLVGLVNGLAPLLISLLIMMPLFLAHQGVQLPLPPAYLCIAVAVLLIFLLGVFLGKIASMSWITSGIRTVLIALITAGLIYLFAAF
jgi:predicted membrane protein (TIGR00267 family)